jgi:hypothetical protein
MINIYVIVSGSKYITILNAAGVGTTTLRFFQHGEGSSALYDC